MDPQGDVPALDPEILNRLEQQFTGEFDQVPPPYSAKKVAGKKLYELARSGRETLVEPKPVTVHQLKLSSASDRQLDVDVTSSTGFYVRSLAHDVGRELGCGGFLNHLRRLAIGPYSIDEALTQENLQQAAEPDEIINHPTWIPIDGISLPFPTISLNRGATDRFFHGQEVIVFRSGSEPVDVNSEVAVRSPSGALLGVGSVHSVLARGRTVGLRPHVVLQVAPRQPESPAPTSSTVARESSS
jgi:tRNA pseudouridine55 synthase